jgi:type I restriction enzyme S subunit
MTQISYTPFAELGEVIAGQHIPAEQYHARNDGTPYLTGPADFTDRVPRITKWTKHPRSFAQNGDVLLTVKGAGCGKSNLGVDAAIGRQLMALRPDPKRLDRDFLFAVVRSQEKLIARLGQGATVPGIGKGDIEELQIPCFPLAKQKHIAAILERADRLRRLRRYTLEIGSSLLFSAFLERFGPRFDKDPLLRFGELVKITGGGTPLRECPEYYKGRIPWLTSKDMRGDYIWDTEEHITEQAIEESCTNLVPAHSILVVVKSKVLMHRLPLAIAKVPICHGQDIKSIQCSEQLHHEFARFVLKYHEPQLLHIARGANTEGLTLPMLQELPVPEIDMIEQCKFADLVDRTERLRAGQRESVRQAEHLFQTLLHRAFTTGL